MTLTRCTLQSGASSGSRLVTATRNLSSACGRAFPGVRSAPPPHPPAPTPVPLVPPAHSEFHIKHEASPTPPPFGSLIIENAAATLRGRL